jgi:predicted aldo/keto reductase-like oxidoreductase
LKSFLMIEKRRIAAMDKRCSRREFLKRAAQATGTLALGNFVRPAGAPAVPPLSRRALGSTQIKVANLGLGFGPLGLAHYSQAELIRVAQTALEEWGGVVYFDVQPDYGEAESYLAPLLRDRRSQIFLSTKTWEQSREKVLSSVRESLRRLQTEYVDALLLNNIGLFDLDRLFEPGGAVDGLKQAKKYGLTRFVGISGHMSSAHFVRALETDQFEIVMLVINFVDRHIYNFEEKVLPIASKQGAAVVAMKVLGGARSLDYSTKQQSAQLGGNDCEPAIRYILNIPTVSAALIGCKSVEEVRLAGEAARRFRPMSQEELQTLLARGKQLAAQWGARLGPL